MLFQNSSIVSSSRFVAVGIHKTGVSFSSGGTFPAFFHTALYSRFPITIPVIQLSVKM